MAGVTGTPSGITHAHGGQGLGGVIEFVSACVAVTVAVGIEPAVDGSDLPNHPPAGPS